MKNAQRKQITKVQNKIIKKTMGCNEKGGWIFLCHPVVGDISNLIKLLDGKFKLDMLVITKSLRGYYKNPDRIAHKVLADRMGVRDPGNKPSSNDRIPYVYIEVKEEKGKSMLQGDRIEHPEYIKENKLKPDYKFYITNQIMKPMESKS